MGHGLAVVFASAGYPVSITDASSSALGTVRSRILDTLKSLDRKPDVMSLVTPMADFKLAVANADLIIEAAPEKLELKQDIFCQLETHAKPDCILASNTSVIPIGKIAAHIKSKHRVAGTHWWNPPYLVPLVEVIQTDGTSPETIATLMDLLTALGKVPVHVKKDVPGFVGNRMQHALWREAIALVAEGVCDAETVDLVVKNSFGRRLAVLGPLENADLVGTDLAMDIQSQLLSAFDNRTTISPYLEQLVQDGKLGFKTGEGFKRWTEQQKAELRAKLTEHLKIMNKLLQQ